MLSGFLPDAEWTAQWCFGHGVVRVQFSDIDPATEAQLDKILRRQSRNPSSAPTLYRLDTFKMYTKLRPGVFELFAALKDKFQFYVYTMGDKQYAHAMASLLDTSGALFKNRIVSNIDCTQKHQKDLDVVMLRGADDLVAILDDTEQVRASSTHVLVHVYGVLCVASPHAAIHFHGSFACNWCSVVFTFLAVQPSIHYISKHLSPQVLRCKRAY